MFPAFGNWDCRVVSACECDTSATITVKIQHHRRSDRNAFVATAGLVAILVVSPVIRAALPAMVEAVAPAVLKAVTGS